MTDVLIRNVPADDLARLDALAARLGISRSDYLRRRISEMAVVAQVEPLSVADLRRAAEIGRDLLDADTMREAWT